MKRFFKMLISGCFFDAHDWTRNYDVNLLYDTIWKLNLCEEELEADFYECEVCESLNKDSSLI